MSIFFFLLFSLQPQVSFDNYLFINDAEQAFLDADFNRISIDELAKFYLLFDYKEHSKSTIFNLFKKKINIAIEKLMSTMPRFSYQTASEDEAILFAEEILKVLHAVFFEKYELYADSFSELISKGSFNCVSSSIIYAMFLHHFGFNFQAVETKDHVFITIKLGKKNIDVETTTPLGFEPGTKKEFFNEFGALTGFSYVPYQNYTNRNVISFKTLMLLVLHNYASEQTTRQNYTEALRVSHISYLGRNDEKGKNELSIAFSNFVRGLAREQKFSIALEFLQVIQEKFWFDQRMQDLCYDIISEEALNSHSTEKLLENYYFLHNNPFKFSHTNQRFLEINRFLCLKIIEYYYNENKIVQAFDFASGITNLKLQDEALYQLFAFVIQQAQINNSYENLFYIIEKTQTNGLMKTTIANVIYIAINNYVLFLNNNSQFLQSIQIINEYYPVLTIDAKRLLKNTYTQYAFTLSQAADYMKAIHITIEAIEKTGNDATSLNNLLFYIKKQQEIGSMNQKDLQLIDQISLQYFKGRL